MNAFSQTHRHLVGVALALTCGVNAELPTAPILSAIAPADEPAGPARLKERTQVTVETNAPGSGATTNPPVKSFDWNFSWQGWNGMHFELKRRTLLGQTVSGVTNLHRVHLEESRMAGKIGAKFAVDAAAFATDDAFTGFDDGAELRRARIYAKGDCLLLIPVSYEFEVGYIPSSFYIENSYLEFRHLGFLGSLKLGQYHVPMGLDTYGSSRDTTFMESASVLQALTPGVNAGWQLGRPVFNERMTWALGMFTDGVGQDFGEATKDFGRAIGRISGLPLWRRDPAQPDSQRLLHLGLSGSLLYANESQVRYRSRPESHLAPYVLDTGQIDADGAYTLGVEVAWVQGPLCIQGESVHSWVREDIGQDVDFWGLYAQASFFLTGESRPYDQHKGTFDRVIPKQPFCFGRGGWGAWETAGRYSFTDLNSGGVQGGRLAMLSAGVNWYVHSHLKWRFDYGFGHVTDRTPEGNLNIFQSRLEVDF